jgi:hypothetical protein
MRRLNRGLSLLGVLAFGACGGGGTETAAGAGPDGAGGEEEVVAGGGEGEAPSSESADANFAITAAPQGSFTVGGEGRAEVTLEGRNGYHVNEEYPIQLTLRPPAGVEVAKTTLAREDASTFEEARAVFPVTLTPRQAGRHEVAGELSFSVCNPQNCLMERRPVSFAVDVP